MEPYDKQRSREVRRRIRAILLDEWDPIGIRDVPEAADEYDGYIGKIYDLISRDAPPSEVEEYLRWAEVEHMGLPDKREKLRLCVAQSLKRLIPGNHNPKPGWIRRVLRLLGFGSAKSR